LFLVPLKIRLNSRTLLSRNQQPVAREKTSAIFLFNASLALAVRRKTFSEKILWLVKKIPRGRVTTYKELARAAGSPRAARAVGNALNKNPRPVAVPCHRVVLSNGGVGGYSRGFKEKTRLLESEGVRTSGGCVIFLQRVFFRFQ